MKQRAWNCKSPSTHITVFFSPNAIATDIAAQLLVKLRLKPGSRIRLCTSPARWPPTPAAQEAPNDNRDSFKCCYKAWTYLATEQTLQLNMQSIRPLAEAKGTAGVNRAGRAASTPESREKAAQQQ
jgi:hypothetical protein